MVSPRETGDRRIEAEAAAWLARVQNEARREEYAPAFQSWLAADVAHRKAFAKATQAWELIAGAQQGALLSDDPLAIPMPSRTAHRNWSAPVAALVGACCVLLVIAAGLLHLFSAQPVHYATGPGEQTSIVLDDGSRISLNTRSAVDVDYSKKVRRIALLAGEAMFEVSKDPNRPFIVQTGNREVKALGTTFVVRRDPDRLSVTLIEGHVNLSEITAAKPIRIASLNPGDRIILKSGQQAQLDRPQPDYITAWRKGDVIFDDVALRDAAAEINRYSTRNTIEVAPEIGALRISGVFTTRDEGEFAVTAATVLGLSIRHDGDRIILLPQITPSELRAK